MKSSEPGLVPFEESKFLDKLVKDILVSKSDTVKVEFLKNGKYVTQTMIWHDYHDYHDYLDFLAFLEGLLKGILLRNITDGRIFTPKSMLALQ